MAWASVVIHAKIVEMLTEARPVRMPAISCCIVMASSAFPRPPSFTVLKGFSPAAGSVFMSFQVLLVDKRTYSFASPFALYCPDAQIKDQDGRLVVGMATAEASMMQILGYFPETDFREPHGISGLQGSFCHKRRPRVAWPRLRPDFKTAQRGGVSVENKGSVPAAKITMRPFRVPDALQRM
jgi:hypothetical protein